MTYNICGIGPQVTLAIQDFPANWNAPRVCRGNMGRST